MEASSQTNGQHASRFDPEFTDNVINATGPKANARVCKVIASLIRHLHDFCRENEITMTELIAGVDMMNRAGAMAENQRNETLILLNILGVESLVDEITHSVTSSTSEGPTASAILGPFWRANAPIYNLGDSIVKGFPEGNHAFLHGRVLDSATGASIKDAEVDVWHTGPNGLYENQDPNQADMNIRGRFYTDSNGEYNFYCLRPTEYALPTDGPGGELLQLLDRHPYRPAHIHFIVSAKGYRPLVTQIFDQASEYVGKDAVFADKKGLTVDFAPRRGDEKAKWELGYDFRLVGC